MRKDESGNEVIFAPYFFNFSNFISSYIPNFLLITQ